MMAVNIHAPINTKMFNEAGQMVPAWQEFFSTLGNKLNAALVTNPSTPAENVTTPVVVAGSDTIDLDALNTTLSRLATEINAIVILLNALNNKL